MITYEQENSPFYIANKEYCADVERQLSQSGYSYSGFCNAYGYEIVTRFDRDGMTCVIKYEKYQTTRQGVVVPMNANDYSGISIVIKGLGRDLKMTIGKGKLRRFFSGARMKSRIPAPFFLSADSSTIDALKTPLLDFLATWQIGSFKLKNGTSTIRIHGARINPIELIDEMGTLFSN